MDAISITGKSYVIKIIKSKTVKKWGKSPILLEEGARGKRK